MMWLFYAVGSAFFAGVTSILAKCGIRKTDSTVATAIRTVVILVFSWLIVFLIGAQSGISSIDGKTLVFLILSADGFICIVLPLLLDAKYIFTKTVHLLYHDLLDSARGI